MGDVNSLKHLQHADNVVNDGAEGGGVVFTAMRQFFSQSNFDQCLGVSSNMDGPGVRVECIGEESTEGSGFSKHACVVHVADVAFAFDVGASKMVMMRDERGAHAVCSRGKASIKHCDCMHGGKDSSKGVVRGFMVC